MKIECKCGAFFYSHLTKDITDFMKAHSVCEEETEPPAVTRAREILEECGIVDVQGTPADQLRSLVELIEEVALKRYDRYNDKPDATFTFTGDTLIVKFLYSGALNPGDTFECFKVSK